MRTSAICLLNAHRCSPVVPITSTFSAAIFLQRKMKMSLLLTSLWMVRSSGLVVRSNTARASTRLFSISTSEVNMGISRLDTLQTLLSKHGAPGSQGCSSAGDLEPITLDLSTDGVDDTPELVSSLMGIDEFKNLHPHLFPLARSKESGNLICALRRAYADDATEWYSNSSNSPWPIVEAKVGGPGMKLLALNSEHLMRRIVCECDFAGGDSSIVDLYNKGLGQNAIADKSLDIPYEAGAVEKLG